MPKRSLRYNEDAAIGLPIRMVVLTTVGLIGFAAILTAVTNAPVVPRPMYAVADIASFCIPDDTGDTPIIGINLLNYDNEPISSASVIIRGPAGNTAACGMTDAGGRVELKLTDIKLPEGKNEGYISIKAMATGYMDHSERYLVKVIRAN